MECQLFCFDSPLFFAASHGMMGFDRALQPFRLHMGVDLRRGNIGMAEHLLHRAQVGAMSKQVRGKTVAQHMR